MSTKGLVTKSYLTDIADAIREKLDSSTEMTVSEMSGNILSILTPEGSYDITENGNYDITEYAKVNVEVEPSEEEVRNILDDANSGPENWNLITKEFDLGKPYVLTDLGSDGYLGWGKFGVSSYDVPAGSYDVRQNGSYDITDYAKVNVAVPQGVFPTGEYDITENGSYDITNYAKVNVGVPIPEGEYEITENGSYDITEYATVSVSVQLDESTIIDTLNNADSGPQNWDLIRRGNGLENDKPYVLSYAGSHGYGGWDQWDASSYEVPAGSYDITENGSYDITNYAKVNVSVEGGGLMPEHRGLYLGFSDGEEFNDTQYISGGSSMFDWEGKFIQIGSGGSDVYDEGELIQPPTGSDAYIYYPGFISGDGFLGINDIEEAGDPIWVSFGSAYADAYPSSKIIYDESLPNMQEGEMISDSAGDNGFVIVRTDAGTDSVIYSAQIPDMQVGDSISVTDAYGNYHYTLTRNS